MLTKYKQYLQSCYNARVLAPADKYLPSLKSPYINLAMIRKGHYDNEQRDEFTARTLHGGIDQILENKMPINIEDLLTPENSDGPVRFILVEGPPGIGKSTFAWEVCRRWDEIESLREFHTVVLLKLREKWVLKATSLSKLFRCPFQREFSKYVAQELHYNSLGLGLLLVLDGFDEVSHSFHENSVIKSILCRQLLPKCTIILTTRPVAKATLESICQPRINKHVEIIGFTEEERVRYITEVFSKEPELQMNFLKYMFLVPHIKSMMYIPLNCAIIAQVYYESQSSHHLAIPRTRTQLYKALTHSLLVRHKRAMESNCKYTSMLPEGLDEENMKMFKTFAKFSFDSYQKVKSRKVTFFKEDIPEGLVHFGFMNESTEMYAGRAVEQTFSFLHLSLQEYLAAWHLADSYSIEFQVAYHRLAVEGDLPLMFRCYKGDNIEEEAIISSVQQQRSLLVEPAIFLAGITGWRCQSEDGRNNWEMYLSHDTAHVKDPRVLLQSLYEAQNPTLLPYYHAANRSADRRKMSIGSFESCTSEVQIHTPYDCYAMSYCLAQSSNQFSVSIGISRDDEVSLVETFSKGLNDHCKSATPRVIKLKIYQTTESVQNSNNCLFWLTQANCWTEVKEMELSSQSSVSSNLAYMFLKQLVKLEFLVIHIPSWEWLPALKSLSDCELNGFQIDKISHHSQVDCSRNEAILLDVEFPSSTIRHDVFHSINVGIHSLLKSVRGSNQITRIALSNITCDTMIVVHNILLHCPSLTILELKRTRLGYDGILYICSALKNNTTLRHLVIHDDLQLPLSCDYTIFPAGKTTCPNLLLELSNIVKNNTLEVMDIQSDSVFNGADSEGIVYELKICNRNIDVAHDVLQTLGRIVFLKNIMHCKLLASPESVKPLQVMHITNNFKCHLNVNILDIEFPMTLNNICNTVDKTIDSIVKVVIRLNTFTKVALSSISHDTMTGVRNILLHCLSLATLELKRTRLGYDGILYISSALRNNTTLRHLVIHDDLQMPPSRKYLKQGDIQFTSFLSMMRVSLPAKTTCTEFLLELNNILKDNNSLKTMKIQSGLFLPLSEGEDGQYCQWTGLGPLQQFNLGAISSGMCPNLRRSFSSSDLTQPKTTLFWDRNFFEYSEDCIAIESMEDDFNDFFFCPELNQVDFKELFSKRRKNEKNLFLLPSFTAPDTEVLQSFSSLDPRLKECLEIPHVHLYVERIRETLWGMLEELKYKLCP